MKIGTKALAVGYAAAIILSARSTLPGAAQESWFFFRGDRAYDDAYSAEIASGEAPPLFFPLFGSDMATLGGLGVPRGADRGLDVSLSTPTFWYSTPYSDSHDISSPVEPSSKIPSSTELQRALSRLPSPLEASLSFTVGPHLSGRADIELNYRRDNFYGSSSFLGWGLSTWEANLLGNLEFPRKTWIAWQSGEVGAAIGRFASGIGSGHFGSTILNPQAPYYDQARLHLGDDRLRFMWMLGSTSAQLSGTEADIQWKYNPDGSSYWDTESAHDYSASRDALKLYAYHMLDWRPFKSLRLGLAEMAVMGGTTPSLNYILPTALWHNTYSSGYSNVGMALLASFVPVKGLQIAGEYFMDDFRASGEASAAKPSAGAWQVSARYDAPNPDSGAAGLSFGAEYTHVDTWTYVRWQPYLTMYQRQVLPGGYRSMDIPLGFDYGPDVDHAGVWAALSGPTGARAELSYEFVVKGPIYMGMIDSNGYPIYYDYDKYAGTGALAEILAQPDEYRHIFSLTGEQPLSPTLKATLSASLALYLNYGNVSGAAATLWMVYAGLTWTPLRR